MTELTVRTDRSLIRAAARSVRYAVVTVVAPVAQKAAERQPIDVAFVLDRSGSMSGEKIELARDAILQGLGMLQPRDRFAVVAYDDHIDVVMPLTSASREAREHAEHRLRVFKARGGTDLGGGWLKGCLQLAEAQGGGATARCLLMSDGQANHGITDPGELERHARELRGRDIVTSTFGVGERFDERLMSGMARAGGGHGYFIQHTRQIGDLLTSELGESLDIVERNAHLTVTLPDTAELELLNDFDVTREHGSTRVRLGNLVSGQSIAVVLKLTLPSGSMGQRTSIQVRVDADDSALDASPVEQQWTWASHEDNDAQPRDAAVDLEVATVYAARARRDALERNRHGDYQGAQQILTQTARRVDRYAGDSPALLAVASSLRHEREEFSHQMSEMSMKQAHHFSGNALMNRSPAGKARRVQFDAEQFAITLHEGVPVVKIAGVRAAIATGTPVSFGLRSLHVLGDDYPLQPQLAPGVTAESIGRHLGAPIDVVLGSDILARYQVLLDLGGRRLVFSRGDLGCDGVSLRMPLKQAVPSAEIAIGSRRGVAFLDTGARLSYMDPTCISTPPVGREKDFFPLLGEFETDVYDVDVELAGLRFRGRFGVLPAGLQQRMAQLGAQWVVGAELLQQFPVVFDLRNDRILLVQGEMSFLAGIM